MRFAGTAALVSAFVVGVCPPLSAQTAEDPVRRLLVHLEQAVRQGNASGYLSLLGPSADPTRARTFADVELPLGITRAVVAERERTPLLATSGNDGYRVIVDVFEEFGRLARISTWRLDLEGAVRSDGRAELRIADQWQLGAIEDLYRLSLASTPQFTARNVEVVDEDLTLKLAEGSVFVAEIGQGPVAVVFVGRGEMVFSPAPDAEKTQVRIFSGTRTLDTRFEALYLRIHPDDFDRLFPAGTLVETALDEQDFRKAERIFHEDAPKSYGLDLGDLSDETWSLLPPPGDLVAEIHTRRFQTLTYSRSSAAAEDVGLFDRNGRKTIALYSSRPDEADRGTPQVADFRVDHYDIDVALTPDRQWIEGSATLSVRVGPAPIRAFTLRLADPLAVQSVISREHGRLFSMRVKDQDTVIVNLPTAVPSHAELALTIRYEGPLQPQRLGAGTIGSRPEEPVDFESPFRRPEPNFLYTNDTLWYPHPAGHQYATAVIRVTVPDHLACVASGEPSDEPPTVVPAGGSRPARRTFLFHASQPLRYLAFVVSRFETVRRTETDFVDVFVESNPRQMNRAGAIADRAAAIGSFYRTVLRDVPYASFTVALIESHQPGGHSPGYFAVLNQPPAPLPRFTRRRDPSSFDGFPDFVLAHELAHQWWGQAVGWSSYREQWLSEGFAQYFAALYAQQQVGDDEFRHVLREMRRWTLDSSDAGPIWLGGRLGHLQNDSRIRRALVYNKAALVLHMLRGLLGDDAFFRGVRRFYQASRFRSVSTADFQRAMEEETGRPLDRFFDGWIYGAQLPRLRFSYRVEGADVVLRVEQTGKLFDLPLSVTLQYADRPPSDVVLAVTDRIVEKRVPASGTVRTAYISRDEPPLAEIASN